MKKLFLAAIALAVVATTAASIPVSAKTTNDKVLKYTPVIDGKLDTAYLDSMYISHEWPSDRSSENYWGAGKYEFTDASTDEAGNKVVGYNTAYDWDCQATSYFLWDDDNLYIAVRVTDTDLGIIDDAHYAMSCEDTGNWGPWLQDSIRVGLSYKGMVFDIRADRAGRYASVFKEENYGQQVWAKMHSWIDHDGNKAEGLFAATSNANGYLIELKIPVDDQIKAKLLKDKGNFKYGISVMDAGSNSPYGLDQAQLAEGIEVEGYQLADFMVLSDGLNSADRSPDTKIILSSTAPTNTDSVVVVDDPIVADTTPVTDENGAVVTDASGAPVTRAPSSTNGGSSVQTGDVGIAVAATALAAVACFLAVKKHK